MIFATIAIWLAVPIRGWGTTEINVLGSSAQAAPGGAPAETPIELTRSFNQPINTTTPSIAMRMLGQPFKAGEVPAGDIVTATLNGRSVRIAECNQGGPLVHADGSLRWARLLVDYSGQAIPPGNSAALQLTAVPGRWRGGSNRSDADWQNLNDVVSMTGITASILGLTGTTGLGYTTPAGTWTASFNSAATVIHICATALGNLSVVIAPFINGSTPHVQAVAVMEYWDSQLASGAQGPIFSKGPFIWNLYLTKTNPNTSTITPASFQASFSWTRGGMCPRTYGGNPTCSFPNVAVWQMTSALLMRPDADWDCWYNQAPCSAIGKGSADNTAAWVWEDYRKVRATRAIGPYADGIPIYYNPAQSVGVEQTLTNPQTAIASYNSSTGIFTLADAFAIAAGNNGGSNFYPGMALEFNDATGLIGLLPQTPYWVCFPTGSQTNEIGLYDTQIDSLACGTGGRIKPTGSIPADMTARLVIAPESYGRVYADQGGPGSRPDLYPLPEWAVAYAVAPISPIPNSTWDAYDARRFGRINGWLDWSIPQHVLSDQTNTIISALNQSNTPSAHPNMGGGIGLGTAQPNIVYANLTAYPNYINGGYGPAGGFGIWGPGNFSPCQVSAPSACGDINAQHYPGNGPYLIWLLEGDPILQLDIETLGARGLSDNSVSGPGVATYNGTTYYAQWMLGACTRCVAHAAWDISFAAYAAPEGSAEQQYWRENLAEQVTLVDAFMATMPKNYQALWPLGYNPSLFGTVSPGSTALDVFETFQQAYLQWGLIQLAATSGQFVTGLNTIIRNGTTVPLYASAVGLGGATGATPCTFWADFYQMSFGLNDFSTPFPGIWISNLNELAGWLAQTSNGSQFADTQFTGGQAPISAPNGPWVLGRTADLVPQNGDYVRFYDWSWVTGHETAVPMPFNDNTDYCVVGTPTGTGMSFKADISCSGSGIVASNSIVGPPWPQTTWIPGPHQACPSTGSVWSGSATGSESYLMYVTAMSGYFAAAQGARVIDVSGEFGLTNPAETAYLNMNGRLGGGGIPSQCQSAGVCMGDHW